MSKILDTRGYSCPLPLMKTREALTDCNELTVLTDDPAAKENILKFVKSQHLQADWTQNGPEYSIHIRRI